MPTHTNLPGKASQGFIRCVIDHFLDDVGWILGSSVHSRAFLDRFKALEYPDTGFNVTIFSQDTSSFLVSQNHTKSALLHRPLLSHTQQGCNEIPA